MLGLPAAALAATSTRLEVSPPAPHVTESVRIGFTAPRIRRGYQLEVSIVGAGRCKGKEIAVKTIERRLAAGERVSVTFSPWRDDLVRSGTGWCRGLADASVTVNSLNTGATLRTLGGRAFKFSAAPQRAAKIDKQQL
jgi:hypothetical protein